MKEKHQLTLQAPRKTLLLLLLCFILGFVKGAVHLSGTNDLIKSITSDPNIEHHAFKGKVKLDCKNS
jgi:hypothetical protein